MTLGARSVFDEFISGFHWWEIMLLFLVICFFCAMAVLKNV